MTRLHEEFWTGVRDAVPLQLGLIPYGVIAGVAWKTQDVTVTVVIGMVVLWTVQYAPI